MRSLLTVEQASNYLNVHPETIRRWVKSGKLVNYAPPGARAIRVDLDALSPPKCLKCGGIHENHCVFAPHL